MSSNCEGPSCQTSKQSCDETSGCESSRCPCGTDCGGDPVGCAQAMWGASFFQAMKSAQVEILKAKIQKAWGAKMEKAADIVLEAMGAKFQVMLAEAQAKSDVRAKLHALYQEGRK